MMLVSYSINEYFFLVSVPKDLVTEGALTLSKKKLTEPFSMSYTMLDLDREELDILLPAEYVT